MESLLKIIPWKMLFSGISKIILHFISKRENDIKAKKIFLEFLDEIKHDVPVKLNSDYRRQTEELLREMKVRDAKLREAENYKKSYEILISDEGILRSNDSTSILHGYSADL